MISIIIPVYNVEEKIDRCIETLTTQTYSDIEIILVNDGSKDNSLAHCIKWKKKDSRIKVYSQENRGVSATRNFGIAHAKGEFITFVDSDDYVDIQLIEKLANTLSDGIDWAVCCMTSVFSDKKITESHKFKHGDIEKCSTIAKLLINNDSKSELLAGPYCKLFRKSIITQNNIQFDINVDYGEDWLFNINYCRFSENACFIKDTLYYYDRTSEFSLSTKLRQNDFDTAVYIRNILANWFPQDQAGPHLYRKIIWLHCLFLKSNARHRDIYEFINYAKLLFNNKSLKKAFDSLSDIQIRFYLPAWCIKNNKKKCYIVWAIIISMPSIAKRYIKKILIQ